MVTTEMALLWSEWSFYFCYCSKPENTNTVNKRGKSSKRKDGENHIVSVFKQIRRRRPTPATLQIYRQPGTGEGGGRRREEGGGGGGADDGKRES